MARSPRSGLLAAAVAGALFGYGMARVSSSAPRDDGLREALARQQALLERQTSLLETLQHQARNPPQAVPGNPPPAMAFDAEALRAEVGRIVREELAAARASESPAHPEPKAEPASPANIEAHTSSQRLLELAFSRRQWNDEDALELRRLLPQLTAEQRQRVLKRIATSINNGELELRTSGPLS